MAKNLISKAMDALTRCPRSKGTGQMKHYHQTNEVIKNGRLVALTASTVMTTCQQCGGSGRSR